MILYYAMGGGLGHLVRARAVLHTLGLEGRAALVTASPYARDRRVVGEVPVHLAPPEAGDADRLAYRRWLGALVRRLEPEEIYVDTFPVGLLGELADLRAASAREDRGGAGDRRRTAGPRLVHVARLLQWPAYARAFPDVARARLHRTYLAEALHADHEAALRAISGELLPLELRDPAPDASSVAGAADLARGLPARFWLVVHSGPRQEVAELVAYARDLQRLEGDRAPIVVANPQRAPLGDDLLALDLHPATPLFARAARVVSACGFNVMRQMAPYRERHRVLPLPRRYDDQFTRAARWRAIAGSEVAGVTLIAGRGDP
ncbi:MAG TPA: hypothetical protein VFH68_15410 [Polyangia bacterium]|nr:hypothetical protein [Polyangia bacterium]